MELEVAGGDALAPGWIEVHEVALGLGELIEGASGQFGPGREAEVQRLALDRNQRTAEVAGIDGRARVQAVRADGEYHRTTADRPGVGLLGIEGFPLQLHRQHDAQRVPITPLALQAKPALRIGGQLDRLAVQRGGRLGGQPARLAHAKAEACGFRQRHGQFDLVALREGRPLPQDHRLAIVRPAHGEGREEVHVEPVAAVEAGQVGVVGDGHGAGARAAGPAVRRVQLDRPAKVVVGIVHHPTVVHGQAGPDSIAGQPLDPVAVASFAGESDEVLAELEARPRPALGLEVLGDEGIAQALDHLTARHQPFQGPIAAGGEALAPLQVVIGSANGLQVLLAAAGLVRRGSAGEGVDVAIGVERDGLAGFHRRVHEDVAAGLSEQGPVVGVFPFSSEVEVLLVAGEAISPVEVLAQSEPFEAPRVAVAGQVLGVRRPVGDPAEGLTGLLVVAVRGVVHQSADQLLVGVVGRLRRAGIEEEAVGLDALGPLVNEQPGLFATGGVIAARAEAGQPRKQLAEAVEQTLGIPAAQVRARGGFTRALAEALEQAVVGGREIVAADLVVLLTQAPAVEGDPAVFEALQGRDGRFSREAGGTVHQADDDRTAQATQRTSHHRTSHSRPPSQRRLSRTNPCPRTTGS